MVNKDRVKFWNSLFHSAWESTKTVYEAQNKCKSSKSFHPVGGRTTDDQENVLHSLLFTTLAIESRINHLIIELTESGKISDKECRAIQQLNIRDKWFLLPKIAGKRYKLDASKAPHQAICEICSIRNSLIHVNFNQLIRINTQILSYEVVWHWKCAISATSGKKLTLSPPEV